MTGDFYKTKIDNVKYWIIKCFVAGFVTVFILMHAGCTLIPKEERILAPPLKEPPKVVCDTVKINKTTFEKKIEVTGFLISTTQKDLFFKNTSGRLKGIYVKNGDQVKKGTLIAELFTEDLEMQIKLQEICFKKAQLQYDTAVNSGEVKTRIQQLSLDLKTEIIKLDYMKSKMALSKLVSPIDGVLDYITSSKEGSFIDTFQTIATVADPNDLQVAYSEDRVSEFEQGMKVDVMINNVICKGEVIMTPQNAPQDADDKTKNSIRIKLESYPEDARMGDNAGISLMIIKKENVIVLNKRSIRSEGARKYVNVLENGLKKERDIETGDENTLEAVVVKGLVEGDLVIR